MPGSTDSARSASLGDVDAHFPAYLTARPGPVNAEALVVSAGGTVGDVSLGRYLRAGSGRSRRSLLASNDFPRLDPRRRCLKLPPFYPDAEAGLVGCEWRQ